MNLLCVCPTYGRPQRLVENTIACFEAQDHPDRFLVVLDDLGNVQAQYGDRWLIVSRSMRCRSLPEKYNELCRFRKSWDAVVVWEDDDLYLPWHLSSIADALESEDSSEPRWAHPAEVWSTHGRNLQKEPAPGRFHAALAMNRAAFERVGGWPRTERADFDQQLLSQLRNRCGEPIAYDGTGEPSYVFRWEDTQCAHGQGSMRGPDDTAWYRNATPQYHAPIGLINPQFDPSAESVMRMLSPDRL